MFQKKILLLLLPLLFPHLEAFGEARELNPLLPVSLESPRDTMRTFMDAMNAYRKGEESNDPALKQKIDVAIRTLDLSDFPIISRNIEGKRAAIFLKEVIDRVIVIHYSKIPVSIGEKDPPWRLKSTEIAIDRVLSGERRGQYLFTKNTVERAEEFYLKVKHLSYKKGSGKGAAYSAPWIESRVPAIWRSTYFLLANWQWLGVFLSIVLGLFIRRLGVFFVGICRKVLSRSRWKKFEEFFSHLEKPSCLLIAALFWLFSIHILHLEGTAYLFFTITTKILIYISILWAIYCLIDIVSIYLKSFVLKTETDLDDQLLPLIIRSMRIFVVVFGVLLILQSLGVNVVSVLAGLGLGGLAFALAARDTCANLFGSLMILLDRPFKTGDWICINDLDGTVEEIGFRSTRIRTFYDSLVTVPNSIVAGSNVDNYGQRKWRRILAKLGVTYDTSPEKLEAFVEGIKEIVRQHPQTRKDNFHVVFNAYQDSCLEVMLYCFLGVSSWSEELLEREKIYCAILVLAKKLGVSFAFPTQSVHLESMPPSIAKQFEKQPNI